LGKGDTVLVVASDLYNEAPVWHLRVKAAAERGATVIVAAAHATKLDEFASFVVRYAFGDEVTTVEGLRTKDKIGEAINHANNLVIFYGADGLGLNGTSALAAACANLLTSLPGYQSTARPNNGLIGVWSTPNMQGALEMGFRPADDLAAALQGKTVYIVAADPAGDDPKLAEALKSAKTVIAQDILSTATTELAEIVLPAAAYTEREGTYTSGERRVQRFYPAVPVKPGTKADFSIVAEIAKKCGIELEGRSALLVMNQIAASEPAFNGISYAKLSEVTEQWPIVGRGDLYYGGTGYENTQGLGVTLVLDSKVSRLSSAPSQTLQNREILESNGLVAVPVTKLYDMGTTVAPAKLLESHIGPVSVSVNPATAAKFGILNGGQATVSLNGVEAAVKVRFDESVSTGVVLVYRSFGIPISEPTSVKIMAAEKTTPAEASGTQAGR
jgi:NADH-quinone oxidoreductase subunit G